MNVGELIEALRRYDPDLPAYVEVGAMEISPVTGVSKYDIPAVAITSQRGREDAGLFDELVEQARAERSGG